MENKAIITSVSNKFFPSLINLLTSIKQNYPLHPTIYVYDLGLLPFFKREIELIENVKLIKMPHFCRHWRSCYTWKTYIFSHPLAKLNFYLDAGCELLQSLDEIFSIIDRDNFFLIDQSISFGQITPENYQTIFELNHDFDNLTTIHAGIIGFKNDSNILEMFNKIYESALAGLCLGFSVKEKWRNRGYDFNVFTRNCEIFRHDMTILNIYLRKYFGNNLFINPIIFCDREVTNLPQQFIRHIRLSFTSLNNLNIKSLHKKFYPVLFLNRLIIKLIITMKNINLFIKKKLHIIK